MPAQRPYLPGATALIREYFRARGGVIIRTASSCVVLGATVLCMAGPASPAAPGSPATGVPPPTRLVAASATGMATASGSIRGRASRDFVIHAGAGQSFEVALRATGSSASFNVLPPGSEDVAMFIGSMVGRRFTGIVPIAGDYVVRVYLVRSAARRNESSTYTLKARVTGEALVPLPRSEDAVIPGTPFHAKGRVRCAIPYQPAVRECEAAVIRYAHDGTATVELRAPGGIVRRVLFVKGTPVAADATEPPTSTRNGDTTTVRIGSDECYELPDALLGSG